MLKIKPTPTDIIWIQVNYVGPHDSGRVGEVFNDLFNNIVIDRAPENFLNFFPLLTVPKKNSHGDTVDILPCLDLRQLNPRLKDIN